MEIASFCLMNLITGDLFEAYRVALFDKPCMAKISQHGHVIKLHQLEHDGWIVYHPRLGMTAQFLNRQCEKWFDNLGEL